MPMLEVFGYGSVGVIFLLALFIELLAQRGTLSHATAAITSFAVTAGVGGALVFMIALPDVVLGVLLFALSFVLVGLAAGVYALFVRLLTGQSLREAWSSKDAQAQEAAAKKASA